MKELHGSASSTLTAPIEDCFELLRAVQRYPDWNGDLVREVEVLEWLDKDQPSVARTKLYVAQRPISRSVELTVAVRAQAGRTVGLSRIPSGPSDQERFELSWRLHPGDGTRIELDIDAAVAALPGFLPVGDVGDRIARRQLAAVAKALGAEQS